jgi:hypothetical protein
MDGLDIGGLAHLLNDSKKASEVRESHFQQKPGAASATVVTRRGVGESSPAPNAAPSASPAESKPASKSIWDDEEVPSEDALLAVNDGRPAPRYETSFKQAIGTQDTFLGLGEMTPLTSDCTHLVVKIHFPGAAAKDLNVDIKKTRLLATSKTHRLFTYLPVDVDDINGKAEFDKAKDVLTLTLPIIHEF